MWMRCRAQGVCAQPGRTSVAKAGKEVQKLTGVSRGM